MKNALRIGGVGLLAVACGGAGGESAPPAFAQAVPPPSAFAHPGFVYYDPRTPIAPPVPALRMPPAASRRDWANLEHLRAAAATPRRCNVPQEVADGVYVHVDCYPYRRIPIAVKHATPAKLGLMRLGRLRWTPTPTRATGPHAASLTELTDAVRAGEPAPPPLPDLVDHRLSGTEGPVKDQGDVGACTAFALSSVIDNALRRASQNVTTSPEHVWAHYATPTMEDAASGNLNKAVTTFDALPYSARDACELTRDVTDDCGATYGVLPNTAPGDAALQQRLRVADQTGGHRVVAFEELEVSPPNLDEIVATLASGADLWVAFNIDSSAWTSRRMQNFVIPDWSQPDGGHALAMAGYRRVAGGYQFLVHNSWGPTWGDGGYAWVSQAMVQKWLHLAYKVRTDADAGSPSSPVKPKTDEDCRGDQILDAVTGACAGVCPDQSRPANGQCPNGPAPPPQPLVLPSLPGWPALPGIPAIPGWTIPGLPGVAPAPPAQPQPAPPAQPGAPTPAQPTPPTPPPIVWPWPVPAGIPQFFPLPK